jgi:urease beta subunit
MHNPKILEAKSTVKGARQLNFSQKEAYPMRQQVPSDTTQMGEPCWPVGTMPKGGFRSVFRFDGDTNTKISNTDKPGRKVY